MLIEEPQDVVTADDILLKNGEPLTTKFSLYGY